MLEYAVHVYLILHVQLLYFHMLHVHCACCLQMEDHVHVLFLG